MMQTPARVQRPPSLAGQLTRTLVVWVGGAWLLGMLAVVWYVDQEINYNFDNELVEVSHRMFDIALRHLDDAARTDASATAPLIIATPPTFADADVRYQLVAPGGHVLARSTKAEADQFDVPLVPGFENTHAWRIYTLHHPVRNVYLQVADPLEDRRAAVNRTLAGLIALLLALLPLLAVVLRRAAQRGLQPLQQLAQAIGERDGQLLQPIALPDLPRELHSVQNHVNHLLLRLEQALDVERALAANAAHELRTPLTAARLRLQTALEGRLERANVQAALDALHTLNQRAEKLLQLSRAESSTPLVRQPVNLAQLATTVAQEFWHDDGAADRLELRTPPVQVLGDFDALAIALRNLVENALRYGAGSSVEIIAHASGRLEVRDTGPGVAAALLQSLQQRHVRQSADRAGYGLGLSIVATIAHKHKTRLTLQSPPVGQTHGFAAWIDLPRQEPTARDALG